MFHPSITLLVLGMLIGYVATIPVEAIEVGMDTSLN